MHNFFSDEMFDICSQTIMIFVGTIYWLRGNGWYFAVSNNHNRDRDRDMNVLHMNTSYHDADSAAT
jgi:hypothetical protein